MTYRGIAGGLAGAFGAGVFAMYFLDPHRGKQRRSEVRDLLVHSKGELEKFGGRLQRDAENRVEGAVAKVREIFQHKPPSDYILEQRVHSALGHALSHPGAIEISAKDGSVFLSGWALASEADLVDKTVASVHGVKDVTSYLRTSKVPTGIPALQGGRPRRHVPEFLQQRWSPTGRVLAGCAGLGLAGYGMTRWKSIKNPASIAGSLLLARSILNRPWAAVGGFDKSAGIRIQKTIEIAASPSELYTFWNNPENYPKVFPHVQEVCRLEDDLYQWQVSGFPGVPIKWTGKIVRRTPEELIEWQSVPGSVVENHGVVHLQPAQDGHTRVQIQMSYQPPAGLLGHAFARLIRLDPKSLLDKDFVQLKGLFEKGAANVHHELVVKSDLSPGAAS